MMGIKLGKGKKYPETKRIEWKGRERSTEKEKFGNVQLVQDYRATD